MSEEQYWRRPKEFGLEQFKVFGCDCKKIIKLAKKKGIKGIRNVEIDDDDVRMDVYETFHIERILDVEHMNCLMGDDGTPVPFRRIVISNNPDYKYPDQHVQIDGKDYYLQTVRTNWLDSRIVVMACLAALKQRFPDVWVDSDTADTGNVEPSIIEAMKLAGEALAENGFKFINPYSLFDSLIMEMTRWLKKEVDEDSKKLLSELNIAQSKGIEIFTDDFQNSIAKKLGYISSGIADKIVHKGDTTLKLNARMIKKIQEIDSGRDYNLYLGYSKDREVLAEVDNIKTVI